MRNTARKDEGGAEEERSNLLTSKSCTMAPAGKVDVQQSRGRCKLPPPQLRSQPTHQHQGYQDWEVVSTGPHPPGKAAWGKQSLDSGPGNSSGVYRIPRPP